MAPPTLSNLTNELFELVVQHLDLGSICRLREVSRGVAHKASQNTFGSYFKKMRVELAPKSLKAFAQMTASLLGSLEDLTLVGLVYDPEAFERTANDGSQVRRPRTRDEWRSRSLLGVDLAALFQQYREWQAMQEQGAEIDTLSKAFTNIKASRRPLKCLSLQVDLATGTMTPLSAIEIARTFSQPQDYICGIGGSVRTAAKIFAVAIQCLRKSGLSVSTLDIFSSKPRERASEGYSLPTDALAQVFGQGLSDTNTMMFAELRSLRMKICDISTADLIRPACRSSEISGTGGDSQAKTLENEKFSSLPRMLNICGRLEDLDLDYLDNSKPSRPHDGPSHTRARRFADELLVQAKLSHLQRLNLAGLEMATASLVTLLRRNRASLRILELHFMSFVGDPFSTALEIIARDGFKLEEIWLEGIKEGGARVSYLGERNQPCTRIGGGWGDRNSIRCWEHDTRTTIAYSLDYREYFLQSGLYNLRSERLVTFGCWPERCTYMSIDPSA